MEEIAPALPFNQPMMLAVVVHTSGSVPRHAGALMLFGADGQTWGSIGGGRVEWDITKLAHESKSQSKWTKRKENLGRDLAMCCGGTMEIWLLPANQHETALQQAARFWHERIPCKLQFDGTKETVLCLSETEENLADVRQAHAKLDRENQLFYRPCFRRARAFLLGHGHIAAAVGPLLANIGFEVILADDNETGRLEQTPTWCNLSVPSFSLKEIERSAGPLGEGDAVLVFTREHAIDQAIIEEALERPQLSYVGLIASRAKAERFRKRLLARERIDEAAWQRLQAPMGLNDVICETPQEIAVSIAAELLRRRAIWETRGK